MTKLDWLRVTGATLAGVVFLASLGAIALGDGYPTLDATAEVAGVCLLIVGAGVGVGFVLVVAWYALQIVVRDVLGAAWRRLLHTEPPPGVTRWQRGTPFGINYRLELEPGRVELQAYRGPLAKGLPAAALVLLACVGGVVAATPAGIQGLAGWSRSAASGELGLRALALGCLVCAGGVCAVFLVARTSRLELLLESRGPLRLTYRRWLRAPAQRELDPAALRGLSVRNSQGREEPLVEVTVERDGAATLVLFRVREEEHPRLRADMEQLERALLELGAARPPRSGEPPSGA